MKYKVGQKVRIKTWESLRKEYKLNNSAKSILCDKTYTHNMEEQLLEIVGSSRTLTVRSIEGNKNYMYYSVEEMGWQWSDDMIKCYANIKYDKN